MHSLTRSHPSAQFITAPFSHDAPYHHAPISCIPSLTATPPPSPSPLHFPMTHPTTTPPLQRTCPLTSPHQRVNCYALPYSFTPTFAQFPRRRRPTSAHLRPSNHAQTAPILHTFIKRPMYVRALFYRGRGAMLPYNQIVAPMWSERLYNRNGAVLAYKRIVASMPSEWRYDGNGAFVPYKRIVAPMWSEHLYGGIGKKSIGYPRKVYRVFPESL